MESFQPPTTAIMMKHLSDPRDVEVVPPDSKILIAIKTLMKFYSVSKWNLDIQYYMATRLDPRQKLRLNKFDVSKSDIRKANDKLVSLMKEATAASIPSTQRRLASLSPSHRKKTSQSSFIIGAADWYSSGESDDEDAPNANLDAQSEFDQYTCCSLTKTDKVNFEIFQGWNDTGNIAYTKLSRVARCELCMPASCVISETNSSNAGCFYSKSRSTLKPSILDGALVVRSNSDLVN
ncbi:unnamed protein product [Phytophthora fragariaefolia]|uniref:Unnamed protein product n=1 Tax=Phytophthora fragariaefolia TaxID=1490495 RepID=A0A9W7D2T7_9STRA|nr:unnamed protein product [Phytophthora fragariaefolia]